ncbi:hypothetical protein BBJ28_00014441 [Nothophytophthora sp. Chile5]|nr:hypothetical protein BBJ28_00014441 [Nothophytophthora sp. Chile5]
MYLGTWVAEVSIAHPTGGLLRTFLAMEALTRRISDAQALISILEQEKQQAELVLQNFTPVPGKKRAKKPKSTFKPADELLLQHAIKQLERLQTAMTKKTSKLKALKQTQQAADAVAVGIEDSATKENSKAAHTRTKRHATPEGKPFDLTACECAFVVFNNLESRRRCLQDYRHSDWRLTHRFQPKSLRFRDGKYALKVLPAPEPSNILWENLEVTPHARRIRRGFTNFVTFLLLLVSGAIISAAQSAQQTFKDKAPPAGLCESALPEIFYASPNYTESSPKLSWDLEWNPNATCTPGDIGDTRYHIAYANNVVNPIHVRSPALDVTELHRCVDPCVSESSSTTCHTLPCFDGVARIETGEECETYQASHMLYCLCTTKLQESIDTLGLVSGPRQLWQTYVPCRTFLTDYLGKNAFIVLASAVVVVVNLVLKTTLRGFASFERHTSESAKTSAVALKMFAAQFLNTAIIVLVVNAALSLSSVPVVGELFRGKFTDFQRDWYPTVGMGITMTMLINAVAPQILLLLQLCVLNPLRRCLARRHIRTQAKMDQLYAGPTFDLAVRYPMVLNSVFVTLIFCGGSPVLLFIAALACAGVYWLDKLALIWQYNVKTAYDEELGETVLGLLPWTLVAHLAFSSWMYGNTDLLQAPTLKLGWLFDFFGIKTDGATSSDAMYVQLVAKAAEVDPLAQHGFVVKVLHANVMLMFVLFVLVMLGILLSTLWAHVLLPVLRQTLGRVLVALWRRLRPLFRFCCCCCGCCFRRSSNSVKPLLSPNDEAAQPAVSDTAKPPSRGRSAKVAADIILTDLSTSEPVTLPQADNVVSPATGNGKEDGDAAAEPLVQKSAGVPALSTARRPQPSAAETPTLEQNPSLTVPVSTTSATAEIILPEFTDYFRKSVKSTFRPDKKLGFKRDPSRPWELVRHYQQETVSNGFLRKSGEPMRTWEVMQAPVKTYAIEANTKYRLAVAELVAASKRALASPETIAEKAESPKKPEGVVDVGAIVPAPQIAPVINAATTDLVVAEASAPAPAPAAEAPIVLG